MSALPPLLPYLTVSDGAGAIEFYKKAFGAVEHELHHAPGSTKIMNACLSINGGVFMLSDDFSAQFGGASSTPEALGGSPVTVHLQVEDVDAAWAKAVAAGAIVTMPLADQFWGDRYGQLKDPFGHKWSMAQTKEQLTKSEIEEAAKTSFKM
jgi:PhnB protein